MPTKEQEDAILEIGKFLLRKARLSAEHYLGDHEKWDYAGYVAQPGGGPAFLFFEKQLYPLELQSWKVGGQEFVELTYLFDQLQDFREIDNDKPWIKAKAVIRNDGEFQMLFEYTDEDKWKIDPEKPTEEYEILVGDIFPDALEKNKPVEEDETIQIQTDDTIDSEDK